MSEFVIETRGLSKIYRDKKALESVSITINKNEITAIVGANGAGKSTLFKILLGVIQATSGQVKVLGVTPDALTPALRAKIGYVNEEHTMFGWLSIGMLKQMQQTMYPLWDEAVYQNVISYFDLADSRQIAKLSRGERAGVNLAMSLAQQPEILILDEPTLGLDIVAKKAFLEALISVQETTSCAIIYCSHAIDEIERLAEQLIIMERGLVKFSARPDELLERVSSWIVDFNGNRVATQAIPGLLKVKQSVDFTQLVLLDPPSDIVDILYELGAVSVLNNPVNLALAIDTFLGKHHAGTRLISTSDNKNISYESSFS